MQLLRWLAARAACALSTVPHARALSRRIRRETGADARGHHAPDDQGLAVSILAFLRCVPAWVSARRLSRQWHSLALGESRAGERSVPQLGCLPNDRGSPRGVWVADLRAARWRAVA